jgi:hypothetical protein
VISAGAGEDSPGFRPWSPAAREIAATKPSIHLMTISLVNFFVSFLRELPQNERDPPFHEWPQKL